ncbi:hypothetical protein Tco_0289016, partial [Tanacetum coccineum]
TFFLGLQVKQNKGGIFISQDKYVAEIFKKFDLVNVKAAITPMETKLPLTKEGEGDAGTEKINTAGEINAASIEVNTASKVNTGSIELNTVIEQDSAAGENKGQREGKAPMLSEETPKKTKEQILQEEASLAEAIRLDSLQKEEEAEANSFGCSFSTKNCRRRRVD